MLITRAHRRRRFNGRRAVLAGAALLAVVGCSLSSAAPSPPDPIPTTGWPSARSAVPAPASPSPTLEGNRLLPGMPPPLDARDVYAANRPNRLAAAVRDVPARIWVPNSDGDTVTVIDPKTYRVVRTFRVGVNPHHVVPSWDLKTLWVNNTRGNSLIPIDPATGRVGRPVRVHDPYNLYFTPDGKYAVVLASKDRQIVFRDPRTMAVHTTVRVDCAGVNHADFSVDGRYFIVSCEFSGELLKVDVQAKKVVASLRLPGGGMPQDVKIAPDGGMWYVADMRRNGLWLLDGDRFTVKRLLPTGQGAHGLYVSRDSRYLYVSNRHEGSISLLAFATGKLVAKWRIPQGGSPDMGGLSADGRVLWLAGRYHAEVYAIDTRDGHLIKRIPVGAGPHGLCVYPQPGRYSLGHTGIMR